jgi:hypothetical protein
MVIALAGGIMVFWHYGVDLVMAGGSHFARTGYGGQRVFWFSWLRLGFGTLVFPGRSRPIWQSAPNPVLLQES